MAHVSVTINGKNYRMACDEGQEAHLTSLAKMLDAHVDKLKGSFGEIGDQRLTVMAGIMVADELVELKKKLARLEDDIRRQKETSRTELGELSGAEADAAKKIGKLADRITEISRKLSAKTT